MIGLGQRFGGDDAVGLAVAAMLRERDASEELEVREVGDATALVDALLTPAPVIIVDALLGDGEPGTLHLLSPEALGAGALAAVSSHGLDVGQAIALSRVLHPDAVSPRIQILGVEIARAERFHEGLSPQVLAAVQQAACAVLTLGRSIDGRAPALRAMRER